MEGYKKLKKEEGDTREKCWKRKEIRNDENINIVKCERQMESKRETQMWVRETDGGGE